jgi:hypothetical protein
MPTAVLNRPSGSSGSTLLPGPGPGNNRDAAQVDVATLRRLSAAGTFMETERFYD